MGLGNCISTTSFFFSILRQITNAFNSTSRNYGSETMAYLIWSYFLSGFYFDVCWVLCCCYYFERLKGAAVTVVIVQTNTQESQSMVLSESIYFYLKTLYRCYTATASPWGSMQIENVDCLFSFPV